MPDFSQLLSKPLDEVKRPTALPQGTYFGSVKSYELGESSEKKTPFVKVHFTLSHAGDDVDQTELNGVDLAKRQLNTSFYLTPDADWRLKEFLESCKIDTRGRTFQSTLPDCINAPVMLDVVQRLNSRNPTDPPFSEVKTARGA